MSLRTTQQIGKLVVGQILPRDSNGSYISAGQILVTDNQGKANWTTLSTLGASYSQFTFISTSEGIISANSTQDTLNLREGAGMNLQIVSNALYFTTNAFTAIDISGGNSLLSSNSSNNITNPRLKFGNGNYTKIRGDPGTNTIFFDVDFLSTTQGARATYTKFIIQNNSSYNQPPLFQSLVLDAIVSDASITMIGVDDLQISNLNLSPSCNIIFIGLSTITAAKFSTLYTRALDGVSNLSVSVDTLNNRQINTTGVPFIQFFPVSTAVISFSTMFGQTFIPNSFTPTSNTGVTNSANITVVSNTLNDISSIAATNTANITTVSNTAGTNSANITTISNAGVITINNVATVSNNLTTVSNSTAANTAAIVTISNTGVTTSNNLVSTSNNLTTVSNLVATNSTFTNEVYSTMIVLTSRATGTLSTLSLSTLIVSSLISVSSISTDTLFVAGPTQLASLNVSGDVVAGSYYGDGSHLTGISGGGGGISYLEFYPISTTAIRASTLTTQFYSSLSSIIRNISVGIPSALSTLSLSTGFISARNISTASISTNYGFFSTISAGTIYGKFAGDGSLLTNVAYSVPPVLSTTTLSTGFLSARDISAFTISTNYGFFSTISAGTIFAKFIGDGSGLTGIASGGVSIVPPILSTTLLSTGILTARNISTAVISTNAGFASSFFINLLTTSTVTALLGSFSSISVGQAYISSLTVDSLFIGNDVGFTNMGDIIATSLSTMQVTTANLIAINISVASVSTNYGFFSTISAGTIYGKFAGDGSLLTNVAYSVPPVLSTTRLSTGVLTASSISTITHFANYANFSTISAGTIYGKHIGDGSLLTNLTILYSVPPVLSTTRLSTGVLTASSISTITHFANYANFSTISAGTVYGKFVGDGSGLSNVVGISISNQSVVLNATGSDQTLLIPTGVNSISVKLYGAGGGASDLSAGGAGGYVASQIPVTPGETLTVIVGKKGVTGSSSSTVAGGYGGGGSTVSTEGGTGGGRSAIRRSETEILTAGGGGGGGGSAGIGGGGGGVPVTFAGGNGGNDYGTGDGAGGTSSAGGAGGLTNAGTAFTGGNSIYNATGGQYPGAGGGGYFGGGGGSANPENGGAGGGGSGYADPTLTNVIGIQGGGSASATDGLVVIVYDSTYIGAISIDAELGFFSTISSGKFYGKFFGDGSALTGVSGSGGLSYIPPVISTTLLSTGSLTACNISTNSISTNYGFFSTISAGTIFAKFVGDGSLLSNVTGTGSGSFSIPAVISANTVSTNLVTACNISTNSISTNYGFFSTISAGIIFAKFVGDGSSLTAIPNTGAVLTISNNLTTVSNHLNQVSTNLITVSTNLNTLSNNVTTISNTGASNTSNITTVSNSLNTVSNRVNYLLTVSNYSAVTLSTSYGEFSSLYATNTYISSLVVDSLTIGFSTGYIVMADIVTTSLSSLQVNTANLVATTGTITYGLFSTISSVNIYGKFFGDGSQLTNVSGGGGGSFSIPDFISANTVSTNLVTACNISTNSISTNYGFFSTISAGTIFAKFVGDGSGLSNISGGGGSFAIPAVISANTVSTNLVTACNISTNSISSVHGFFSTISAATIYAKFFGDGSQLTNVPGGGGGSFSIPAVISANTVSTSFITASNISTNSISTNYGFFTTISAATIYAKFFGDGSDLINLPGGGGSFSIPAVISANTVSTSFITASNISTNSISTTFGFVSSLTVNTLQIGGTTGFITMGDVLTNSISTSRAYISTIGDVGFPINLVGYGGIRITDTLTGGTGVLSVDAGGALKWNGSNVTLT